MRRLLLFTAPLLLLVWLSPGCQKDPLTDPSFRLGFSTDTLTFDTVFVTLGSTTKYFTVRNREDRPVIISSIALEGGPASNFRMNVDGEALPEAVVTEVTIPPKDSIYVFVEVTVDPNGEPLPFLLQDRIVFITNGVEQAVQLQAYGQNANFFNAAEIETQTWTDDLPYVVLNSLLVKECHTLTIEPGVTVYFGGNSGLFAAGNLAVNGQADDRVTFRGVRLDQLTEDYAYDDVPGQWRGIFLLRSDICPPASQVRYAEIRNAQFGISMGSTTLEDFPAANLSNGPVLHIENSVIRNHSVFGLYGITSTIEARNLLVHSAGSQLLAFQMGGDYRFEHCTFYNQGTVFLEHRDEMLFFSNYFADPGNNLFEERDLERLEFLNCILYGSLDEEIYADTLEESTTAVNFRFDHCLLRTEQDWPGRAVDCLFNLDPDFFMPEDEEEEPFRYLLSQDSPCVDAGNPVTAGSLDADGNVRDGMPDLGAFEWGP